MPDPIQLRRTKGWRMPPNTVSVARPTRWGNPWVAEWRNDVGGWCCRDTRNGLIIPADDRADALDLALSCYRAWVAPHAQVIRADLAGRNLACWCGLDQPCHRGVLLELANAPLRCEAADD